LAHRTRTSLAQRGRSNPSARLDVAWGDLTVHVIGKTDLIAAKRAAGRERDRRDLDALEREG
jgi:hypothetical protein